MNKETQTISAMLMVGGLDVEFTADVKMEDHGIGPYEFWGACSTNVDWQPTVQTDIEWDKNKYNNRDNALIEEWLEKHEEMVMQAIENNFVI